METKVDQKPPKIKVATNISELDMDTLKKHSHMLVSPTSQGAPRKTPNGRVNCLCSPTTHVGSFRCRHHRASGGIRRGGSVGSNLSELASKASVFSPTP
ncbi:hypothetical protein RJT34_12767 [Clitoria ternatea]|uniref:Uncharacterized protein n=1 Tax=Clitoria ternatea TaxID=43366 RepID=A0AAN9JMB9_CLITE